MTKEIENLIVAAKRMRAATTEHPDDRNLEEETEAWKQLDAAVEAVEKKVSLV